MDCQEGESIAECLSRIEKEKASDLYGDRIPSGTWPRKILDGIGKLEERDRAERALGVYRKLDLPRQFEEPLRFKRVVAYLSYVVLIFYIVVGVYQVKVTPSFVAVYEDFELSAPSYLVFFNTYWLLGVGLISILLVALLIIGFQIRRLFQFSVSAEDNFVIKFLSFPSIRRHFSKIVSILEFPLASGVNSYSKTHGPMRNHLQSVKDSGMCLSTEMQALIEIEMRSLLESCEKQLKLMSLLIAIIVIIGVFTFLLSAYSPIFVLGEMV